MPVIKPTLNIPQAQFIAMPQKFKAFVAGFGCVREDTPVITEYGPMRICDIGPLTRVLSWNEKDQKFQLSLTSGAFPKGKANLYRVLTKQGEFHATAQHRLFSSDYKYQRLESFVSGRDSLSIFQDLPLTNSELGRLLLSLDAPHCDQTTVDFLVNYGGEARQYGQQLLTDQDNDQSFLQEQDGVQELYRCYGSYASLRMGDQWEQKPKHNRHGQSYGLLHRNHSCFQKQSHVCDEEDQILTLLPEHISAYLRKGWQSVAKYVHRHTTEPHFSDDHSSQKTPCLSYTKLEGNTDLVEEQGVFWDICVLDTNNYVTADSCIHHNSGKTWTGCCSFAKHFYEFPKINAGYFAPTYRDIEDVLYPTLDECLYYWGMTPKIKTGKKEVDIYVGPAYYGTIKCRSMDNPGSIVGFKIGHAVIDELDIMDMIKAELAWRKIIARMRYKVDGLKNGIDITTTPEGYKFVWRQFVKALRDKPELHDKYGLLQASTYDNEINLPVDYIPSLFESYPPQLIEAYLNGEFVNLTSGNIYKNFDRKLNHCDDYLQQQEPVYVGMDFNVGKMSAKVHVKRGGLPRCVLEVVDAYDTPDMIDRLKSLLWEYRNGDYNKIRQVYIYPDASGDSRKTTDASKTDISLLKQAGFKIKAPKANPPVKDRINSMNAMFLNAAGERRYLVNTHTCPSYADSLEQQAWNENGEPDKSSGFDHGNDAGGYFINYEYPIVRKNTKITSIRGM